MVLEHVGPGRFRGRGEIGMSLVEALVAMALLLLVAIGILPLFTRSMVNNAAGSEATSVANHARHRIEELGQLPFHNEAISVEGGNERLIADIYFAGDVHSRGDETWDQDGSGTGPQLRRRTTRVRQFRLLKTPGAIDDDLDGVVESLAGLQDTDEDGEFDDPLGPGSGAVHLKEISVELAAPGEDPDNTRNAGPLGAAPVYRIRSFRAF